MGKKGETDENTQEEKAGIALFAEGAKYHPMEMPLSVVSDKKNEHLMPDFQASHRKYVPALYVLGARTSLRNEASPP